MEGSDSLAAFTKGTRIYLVATTGGSLHLVTVSFWTSTVAVGPEYLNEL